MPSGRIIHIPYTFAPDPIGGTEVYVAALADGLVRLGWENFIAAPGRPEDSGIFAGLSVTRLPVSPAPEHAKGVPDLAAAQAFEHMLDRVRPHIVHLHANSAAASYELLRAARARGVRTVFTYHTPTVSCVRGTMLLDGMAPCDGRLDQLRCTRCVLLKHGLPPPVASVIARTPVAVGRVLSRAGMRRGPVLAPRMRQIVGDAHFCFASLIEASDRVVAVCDWVADVLRLNGVPSAKLVVSRQGLTQPFQAFKLSPVHHSDHMRIAYFGRLDPAKGLEILLGAVRATSVAVELVIYGVHQPGSQTYVERLRKMAAGDGRISFADAVPASEIVAAMMAADVIAVPSLGMETGPLVVLEAFAARRPVIGSRRGGIAELVRHEIDGLLLEPGNVADWRDGIERLTRDRAFLLALQANISPPRTLSDVVGDMSDLYTDLASAAAA
jgi:glycosyltransferase involved in cell wall biosynthesis